MSRESSPEVCVYSHPWHLTRSDAFVDLIVDPLGPFTTVLQKAWPDLESSAVAARAAVFCQVLPPREWVERQHANIIWVPMWDDVEWHRDSFWTSLPKAMRVVAFSKAILDKARRAGLRALSLQYFKDPDTLPPASWAGERVLLYWNRRGIVSPTFLRRLCLELSIDRLIFKNDPDPLMDSRAVFTLPDTLGSTRVEHLRTTTTREEYFHLTETANVVVAPRSSEGVGMVFLEGMARGCVVIANNAPTMNEYITHGRNGYLCSRRWSYQRLLASVHGNLANLGLLRTPPFIRAIDDRQDWSTIGALDLPPIGRQAREDHRAGYQRWSESIETLVRFILDPEPPR